MTTHDHEILRTPLSDLEGKTWPGNPKAHEIYKLKLSYKHHGFVTPLVFDEGTERIVAGHGRLQALTEMKESGDAPPDGVHVAVDGDWLVPVVRGITFKDEASAKAYLVADNQLTISGGWNSKAFGEMLRDIESSGMIEAAGMTMDEFEDFAAQLGSVPEVQPEEQFQGGYADSPEEQKERESIIHNPHREVVILLLDDEHTIFAAQVNALKKQWGLDTLKQVLLRAVMDAVIDDAEAAPEVANGNGEAPVPPMGITGAVPDVEMAED